MTNILVGLSALALLGGFISYLHYTLEAYAQTQLERVITEEGEDDMDYVELNGELIPYNEDDQE